MATAIGVLTSCGLILAYAFHHKWTSSGGMVAGRKQAINTKQSGNNQPEVEHLHKAFQVALYNVEGIVKNHNLLHSK